MRRAAWGVLALLLIAVAGVAWWAAAVRTSPAPAPESSPDSAQGPGAAATPAVADTEKGTRLSRRDACSGDRPGPLEPSTVTIAGVGPSPVIAPPRDARGVPGVPPLSAAGKTVFAWDSEQRVRPGDPRGHALLNAHTWPDGSALGNRLLDHLHRGDRVEVRGGGALLCYRVTERVEVPGDRPMPRYYARTGPHQLAIVVCSGRRLGPGVWEKRTVWFARPASS